jgi:hypothetical protein
VHCRRGQQQLQGLGHQLLIEQSPTGPDERVRRPERFHWGMSDKPAEELVVAQLLDQHPDLCKDGEELESASILMTVHPLSAVG